MADFSYKNKILHAEKVAIPILVSKFGTPLYIYSSATLRTNFNLYNTACKKAKNNVQNYNKVLICYSVKSNSNLAILNLLSRLGAGFDIVSSGELLRVIAAGGNPQKTIFSGVGKTCQEIEQALIYNILCFNVESVSELYRLNKIASHLNKFAPVSLRINPNIDAKTHPYISTGLQKNKFGIDYKNALNAYHIAANLTNIKIIGVDFHIGSQLLDDTPLLAALDKIIELIDILESQGIFISYIDIGGGIGIAYKNEKTISLENYFYNIFSRINTWQKKRRVNQAPIKIICEPGRSIVGNAGILVTEIQYLKHNHTKNFAIIDASMNDLMRPALYEAWHDVQVIQKKNHDVQNTNIKNSQYYDIVGSICESSDWLARNRKLTIAPGDLLAIMSAGAYGMTMASNYNTRGKPAEVLVHEEEYFLIRKRENAADLFQLECITNINT